LTSTFAAKTALFSLKKPQNAPKTLKKGKKQPFLPNFTAF